MAEKPTVLLVHGFPLDSRMWKAQQEALSGDFQVVAPDLDGHGASPRGAPAHSMDDIARSLAERLDAAAVRTIHLAGFSMGGYVAFAFLRQFPERVLSLALVDSRAGADNEAGRAGRDAMAESVRERGAGVAAAAMLPKMFTDAADASTRAEVERWMLEQPAEALIADLRAMRDRPDATASLGGIRVPVLVVVGDQDPITSPADAQAMAAAIPGAKLVTIEGAAHLTPIERPGEVSAALHDFFSRAGAK
jgi:3-oxoadipate enol-lactonase